MSSLPPCRPRSPSQRWPREVRTLAETSPSEPTDLDAENLAGRLALDEPTEVTAELAPLDVDAQLGYMRTKRASSRPPPLPMIARAPRSVQASLAPTATPIARPRRLAVGTIDGEPPVPRAMGGYTIMGILASGSMGVVLRGEHATLRHPVAIKVMHPRLQKRPADVARFFAEAVTTARITHPNVVRCFDFGYDQTGAAFIVMDLLDGEPLSCRLARERRLDIATAVDIAIQIGHALVAAHKQGVVHRDIKPDNVFLCGEPGSLTVKLLDFGVAKVDDHSHGTMHTQEGDLLGTPCYMAPEQGLSASSSDARSDLYSVGCLLYEMLCGVVPFEGNMVETLLAHQTSVRPSARATRPEVPPELDALIERMMARDPIARPQSGRELVETLRTIKASPRMTPTRTELVDQTSRIPRVLWDGWLILVVALAVVLGIATTVMVAQ